MELAPAANSCTDPSLTLPSKTLHSNTEDTWKLESITEFYKIQGILIHTTPPPPQENSHQHIATSTPLDKYLAVS